MISLDRYTLRRRNVVAFIHKMARRHPELAHAVTFRQFLTIARRERVTVMILPLSRPARLVRIGAHAFIQINKALKPDEQCVYGFHELCHFWRDDPGEACYNAEEDIETPEEHFADVFAWVVTSPARVFIPGLRDEDF